MNTKHIKCYSDVQYAGGLFIIFPPTPKKKYEYPFPGVLACVLKLQLVATAQCHE